MGKTLQLFLLGTAVAAALSLAPAPASAANCTFSKKRKSAAVLPTEDGNLGETRFLDRRRQLAI